MKNWLGIMIVALGAAACQLDENPAPTEGTTESTTEQAATSSDVGPYFCGAPLPALLWWAGLPASTSTTVALLDSKSVPGYWRIYGADPVKGAVLWARLAVPSQQAASVMTSFATLASGYRDYTRPPPCGVCPVGDGWVAEHALETARLHLGIKPIANDLTAACYQ